MSIDELVTSLADRGVQLYLDGDRLRFKAPVGALTSSLRDGIAAHRIKIIERLKAGAPVPAVGRRCTYCDWRDWVDEPPKDGRIRTTCGKCGRFIGYRPMDSQPGRN
ncbi:MAG: hypothetical protein AB7O59_11155 [Pirellulales bacterium]